MYIPMLKAMSGDYAGITQVSQKARRGFKPFFLVQNPKDADNSQSLESYLHNIGLELARITPRDSFFLDLPWFKREWRVTDDRHPLAFIHERLRGLGANPIVVVGLERDDAPFLDVAYQQAKFSGSGICIRLEKLDFEDSHYAAEVLAARVGASSLDPSQIDLLLDCGDLQLGDLSEVRGRMVDFLSLVANVREFRSLTLAGTSIPQSFSKLARFEEQYLRRLELALWRSIRSAGYPQLNFGDYGVNNTRPIDKSKKIPNVLAKIRYSVPGAWLAVRGQVISKKYPNQYNDLAKVVVSSSSFRARDKRWGHMQISQRAALALGPGRPADWVAIDLSNHINNACENFAADAKAVADLTDSLSTQG